MIQVGFSEVVNVTGSPQITLETGGNDGIATLLFGIRHFGPPVQLYRPGPRRIRGPRLCLEHGRPGPRTVRRSRDAAGNDSILTLPVPGAPGSLGANKDIVIDTPAPAAPNAPDLQAASDSGDLEHGQCHG